MSHASPLALLPLWLQYAAIAALAAGTLAVGRWAESVPPDPETERMREEWGSCRR